ncbi:hypothetical protein B0O99DRAFT_607506 [Bisporella sp. PMI_857]|nr:hypothetical protein B0O99DRAFT_607506 [Bisporella sp. PMI_857]
MATAIVKQGASLPTQSFTVQKNFICCYSPYFVTTSNNGFAESEKKELELEADLGLFSLFVNWI